MKEAVCVSHLFLPLVNKGFWQQSQAALDWPLQQMNKKDNTEKESKTEREGVEKRETQQQTRLDLTTGSMLIFME